MTTASEIAIRQGERRILAERLFRLAVRFGGWDDTCACVGDLLEIVAELQGLPLEYVKREWSNTHPTDWLES